MSKLHNTNIKKKRVAKPAGRPTKIDWEAIEVLYKKGDRVCDIAYNHDINPTMITNKAKLKGWKHKELQEEIHDRQEVVTVVTTATTPRTAHMTDRQLDMISDLVTVGIDPILQRKSKEMIDQFMEVTSLSLEQTKQIMQNAPDGLYTKSAGNNGTVYDRTTSFLKDLTPIMQALQAYTGVNVNNSTTNVQVNNTTASDEVVQFYIPDNNRDK